MPNWVNNQLNIDGDKKEITRFKKLAKKGKIDLTFEKLFPLPKELENTTSPSEKPNNKLLKKYGFDNWYDWNVYNWGTKWNIEGDLLDSWKESLYYEFDSAWSPPINAFIKISKDFPSLLFRLKYDEPEMRFMGATRIHNGNADDKCMDY